MLRRLLMFFTCRPPGLLMHLFAACGGGSDDDCRECRWTDHTTLDGIRNRNGKTGNLRASERMGRRLQITPDVTECGLISVGLTD
jgi:hypothetical protein